MQCALSRRTTRTSILVPGEYGINVTQVRMMQVQVLSSHTGPPVTVLCDFYVQSIGPLDEIDMVRMHVSQRYQNGTHNMHIYYRLGLHCMV